MTEQPLVSVVVPFLNAATFLEECIESVVGQTYAHWELLLVDDGSTDRSTEVAREYTARHADRIRYVEHPGHENRGATTSRNLGIRHARGRYVAFLDADDAWLPAKLAEQVAIAEAEPEVSMVHGAALCWRSWTGAPDDLGADEQPATTLRNRLLRPPSLLTIAYPLGKEPAPPPSDLLVRRSLLDRIGGFEEGFQGIFQLYEDQAFLAKVYLHGAVYVADACWTKYRIHPNSCVARVRGAGHRDLVRLFYFEWLEKYLASQGVRDREVWRRLRSRVWQLRHPALYGVLRDLRSSRLVRAGIRLSRLSRLETVLPRVRPHGAGAGRTGR
jgi:glycosyltransferase involved in cell wall biosynthesis